MATQTTLTFAGDASSLQAAARQAERATTGVADAATESSRRMGDAAAETQNLTSRLGSLGAATEGAAGALDSVGASLQAVVDLQNYARERAQRLEQALNDVKQAQVDYNQAVLDGKQALADGNQAMIDAEQAALDEAVAVKDLAAAEKEHGVGSDEAKQAAIDLKQARQDLKQATLDAEQATVDGTQSTVDAKQAMLDLAEAQREANPSTLQEWADKIAIVTPLVMALVGVIALVTAAQWAWNAAQLASPTTWIVLAIAAIIAGIVLLVMQWDTVKEAGGAAWDWIVDKAKAAWDWIKGIPQRVSDTFSVIGSAISMPFRAAFNAISDAWNNTIGRLSWTVPGWIPGVGGNTVAAPRLPRFHQGGTMPGAPGTEGLALLQAGEKVIPASAAGGGGARVVHVDLGPALMALIQQEVGARGGDVQIVLGGARG